MQQLDTAINWGRYAGLFDYDSATHKFYIPEEEDEITENADSRGDEER